MEETKTKEDEEGKKNRNEGKVNDHYGSFGGRKGFKMRLKFVGK